MQSQSPLAAMKSIESQIKLVLRGIDFDEIKVEDVRTIKSIKYLLSDARLDIRDYEFADTKIEQQLRAGEARKRLQVLAESILAVGEVFSVADTAQILAELDHIEKLLN